ncbi:LOW QUALITY PROTEIN: hypothetical protein KIPB_009985, partial [Kipferlia bialata]
MSDTCAYRSDRGVVVSGRGTVMPVVSMSGPADLEAAAKDVNTQTEKHLTQSLAQIEARMAQAGLDADPIVIRSRKRLTIPADTDTDFSAALTVSDSVPLLPCPAPLCVSCRQMCPSCPVSVAEQSSPFPYSLLMPLMAINKAGLVTVTNPCRDASATLTMHAWPHTPAPKGPDSLCLRGGEGTPRPSTGTLVVEGLTVAGRRAMVLADTMRPQGHLDRTPVGLQWRFNNCVCLAPSAVCKESLAKGGLVAFEADWAMPTDMQMSMRKVDIPHIPSGRCTCTLIGDGQVLIVGKDHSSPGPHSHTSSIVTFHPDGTLSTGSIACPLTTTLDSHSATRIGDSVYVFGGSNGSFGNTRFDLDTLGRFDIATKTWTRLLGEGGDYLPYARGGHVAADVDGSLVVVGGWQSSLCASYDPGRDSWTSMDDACGVVYRAGDVVVDGTLHCFGGQVNDTPLSQHISCDLGGGCVWTQHTDMPFHAVDPAVWHLPPYIVVAGGHGGRNTPGSLHALHLQTNEWEEWQLPVRGHCLSQCRLNAVSTLIHGPEGSYVVSSGTMRDSVDQKGLVDRMERMKLELAVEADQQAKAQREKALPEVQRALTHLSAVVPALKTSVDGYGSDVLRDMIHAIERGVRGLTGHFYQAEIPSASDLTALQGVLEKLCHSTMTAQHKSLLEHLGAADSAAAHLAELQKFIETMPGSPLSLSTDYAGLHSSITAVSQSLENECSILFAEEEDSVSQNVPEYITHLSSVLDCLSKADEYTTIPLPPDISALGDMHLERYNVVVAHNMRVCTLTKVARVLRHRVGDVAETLSRLQGLQVPSIEVIEDTQERTATALGSLYDHMQEAADAKQLLSEFEAVQDVSEGDVSDLMLQSDILVAKLAHMRLSPSEKAKVEEERRALEDRIDGSRAALASQRHLCDMLERHSDFVEVAEFFASHQYEHPLDRHNLAPYRPLFLDMPLSQLSTEPFPSSGRVPLLSGEHPSMGRAVLKKYCLSDPHQFENIRRELAVYSTVTDAHVV